MPNELIFFVLFSMFFILIAFNIPIAIAVGTASFLAMMLFLPFDTALQILTHKLWNGLNTFSLMAIPFFVLAGSFINHGGIAQRMINLAQLCVGRVPGSLLHVNILTNMLFGALSGSAVASASAVGSIMRPEQQKLKYQPALCAAVNAASCTTGLIIPPSNVMIIYALSAGSVSVSGLFLAGYIPGILMGIGLMIATARMIVKEPQMLTNQSTPSLKEKLKIIWRTLPSLLMMIVVIGGLIGGVFTATEASAVAVLYGFIFSVIIYQQVRWRQIPRILLESAITSSVVLFLVACSITMSWVLNNANLMETVNTLVFSVSSNLFTTLLLMNIILLIVGTFMDITPAILIFTPIFLPVAERLGMHPLHFGIMMTLNLCIGLITPPVGSALFVSCSVGQVSMQAILRPITPLYLSLILVLALVTYVPHFSLYLPQLFGYL